MGQIDGDAADERRAQLRCMLFPEGRRHCARIGSVHRELMALQRGAQQWHTCRCHRRSREHLYRQGRLPQHLLGSRGGVVVRRIQRQCAQIGDRYCKGTFQLGDT